MVSRAIYRFNGDIQLNLRTIRGIRATRVIRVIRGRRNIALLSLTKVIRVIRVIKTSWGQFKMGMEISNMLVRCL